MAQPVEPRTTQTKGNDGSKKEIWSSMLDSVASGRKLPEKTIFALGGTPDSQKEFLKNLTADSTSAARKQASGRLSRKRAPPIANQFALGYTYHDVLDADHEDTLARLSIYFLSEPSHPSMMRLLQPLLNPEMLSSSLVVILLDWSQPWNWLRQLRDWIRSLRDVLASLDEDCQAVMEQVMKDWRDDTGRTGVAGGGGSNAEAVGMMDGDVSLPRGPGEWDDPLGLPLCVVCQHAEQTENLEREQAWREEDFDFVLQIIRVVLLKHGSSLIYTNPATSTTATTTDSKITNPKNPLQTLIHTSLGIQSLLPMKQQAPQQQHQRGAQALQHNVVDRDKVLIPSNWDSWAKIRILRNGFDVEGVNKAWARDLLGDDHTRQNTTDDDGNIALQDHTNDNDAQEPKQGAIAIYEETVRGDETTTTVAIHSQSTSKPSADPATAAPAKTLEVTTQTAQEFLAKVAEVMDRLRTDEEARNKRFQDLKNSNRNEYSSSSSPSASTALVNDHDLEDVGIIGAVSSSSGGGTGGSGGIGDDGNGQMSKHIGPVQFNMGGIQIDADDMLKRIKNREAERITTTTTLLDQSKSSASAGGTAGGTGPAAPQLVSTPDAKSQNEALASFFAGLMKRGGGGGVEDDEGNDRGGGTGSGLTPVVSP